MRESWPVVKVDWPSGVGSAPGLYCADCTTLTSKVADNGTLHESLNTKTDQACQHTRGDV